MVEARDAIGERVARGDDGILALAAAALLVQWFSE